jgi:hypothetical protein
VSWDVDRDQWKAWIERDGRLPYQKWISCDAFDESLRRRLELQPFLGMVEHTVVGRVEETTVSPPPGGDPFDSMATVIRMVPDGLRDTESPEAGRTLVQGRLEAEQTGR